MRAPQKKLCRCFFFSNLFLLLSRYAIWFSCGKLESTYISQDTLNFLEGMYMVLGKRCYIYASMTEHVEFEE